MNRLVDGFNARDDILVVDEQGRDGLHDCIRAGDVRRVGLPLGVGDTVARVVVAAYF